jgi:hypothetical protein
MAGTLPSNQTRLKSFNAESHNWHEIPQVVGDRGENGLSDCGFHVGNIPFLITAFLTQ